jgi:hypothetical protein
VQVSFGHKLARCRQCGWADFAEEFRPQRSTAVLRCRQCGRKTRRLYLVLQIADEMVHDAQGEAAASPAAR